MRWKDNPDIWEEMYGSNDLRTLENYGLSNSQKISLIVKEEPDVLKGVRKNIEAFWKEFTASRLGFTNDPKYALSGLENLSWEEEGLVLRVFPTDYATVRFKNSRRDSDNETLTDEQINFLDNKFLTLGVGGYVCLGDQYLLGERADTGARSGLLECVPQGLVDSNLDGNANDVVREALRRELEEETSLDLSSDIRTSKITHLNIGPKYGDFTVIYQLLATRDAVHKAVNNPKEHIHLQWSNLREIKRNINSEERYGFNPGSVPIFKLL